MDIVQIILLAVIQGAAELLPISSSAHVIVAEKMLGIDPTSPPATLLLVMLHTGTMLAVIVHYWKLWQRAYFQSVLDFRNYALRIVVATAATVIVGLVLLQLIKYFVASNLPDFEIEHLFGNARLMAASLASAGMLIIASARFKFTNRADLSLQSAAWIGAAQGLCLPFRGFSRSGATISAGLVLGIARQRAEEFSFALAVVLTPAVIVKEAWRLYKSESIANTLGGANLLQLIGPSLLGMGVSFLAGLLALRWLANWLHHGRWPFFGIYCLFAACVVLWVG